MDAKNKKEPLKTYESPETGVYLYLYELKDGTYLIEKIADNILVGPKFEIFLEKRMKTVLDESLHELLRIVQKEMFVFVVKGCKSDDGYFFECMFDSLDRAEQEYEKFLEDAKKLSKMVKSWFELFRQYEETLKNFLLRKTK